MTDSCLISAEAGVNHNGTLDMAPRLVEAAAKTRVDMVKFQTFRATNSPEPSLPRPATKDAALTPPNASLTCCAGRN